MKLKEKFHNLSYTKRYFTIFFVLLIALAFIIVLSIVTQGWGLLIAFGIIIVGIIAGIITEEINW